MDKRDIIITIIIIIAIMIIIVAVGVAGLTLIKSGDETKREGTNVEKVEKNININRFDISDSVEFSSYEISTDPHDGRVLNIITDKETSVQYLLITDNRRYGNMTITPLYNQDGSLFSGLQFDSIEKMSGGK